MGPVHALIALSGMRTRGDPCGPSGMRARRGCRADAPALAGGARARPSSSRATCRCAPASRRATRQAGARQGSWIGPHEHAAHAAARGRSALRLDGRASTARRRHRAAALIGQKGSSRCPRNPRRADRGQSSNSPRRCPEVEIGDEIPVELYRAVAEVLSFILRASGRLGPPLGGIAQGAMVSIC